MKKRPKKILKVRPGTVWRIIITNHFVRTRGETYVCFNREIYKGDLNWFVSTWDGSMMGCTTRVVKQDLLPVKMPVSEWYLKTNFFYDYKS